MKKNILISIVIFFAIYSKSWADDWNGKGLVCVDSSIGIVIYYIYKKEIREIIKINENEIDSKINQFVERRNNFVFWNSNINGKPVMITLQKEEFKEYFTKGILFLDEAIFIKVRCRDIGNHIDILKYLNIPILEKNTNKFFNLRDNGVRINK